MRKLLNNNILVVAALAVLVVGCGGSPTAPTSPVVTPGAVTPPAPAPTPAPEPTPEPLPPPSPAPPAPAPADPVVRYNAHVETVQWYGTPLFTSPDIEILRFPDRIVLGSLTLPIVIQENGSVVARTPEMSFSAVDSQWSFNGTAGQGSGVWIRQAAPPR